MTVRRDKERVQGVWTGILLKKKIRLSALLHSTNLNQKHTIKFTNNVIFLMYKSGKGCTLKKDKNHSPTFLTYIHLIDTSNDIL